MREILFRGKKLDDGRWVEGCLLRSCADVCRIVCQWASSTSEIIEAFAYEVDSDTVGQYTGLMDKNRKKIFEGDLVMFRSYTEPAFFEWNQEDARWYMRFSDCLMDLDYMCIPRDFEVIGNIHDNPELIVEVEDNA